MVMGLLYNFFHIFLLKKITA